jgi:hypothetical protein
MNDQDLVDRIKLILSQSEPDKIYGLPLYDYKNQRYKKLRSSHLIEVDDNPTQRVVNEPVGLLKLLYSGLSPGLQNPFKHTLVSSLWGKNKAIVVHTFVELRMTKMITVFEGFFSANKEILDELRIKLSFEHDLFTEEDLKHIEELTEKVKKSIPPILHATQAKVDTSKEKEIDLVRQTIERVRYLRLRKDLRDNENPELNTDKQALLSRMQSLGYTANMTAVLQEIDRKVRSASTSFDFKGCLDLTRTFFEEFFEASADKVAAKNSAQLPPKEKSGHFLPFKQFLKNSGLLSITEEALAQSIYNCLSEEGSHNLTAAPEQMRVLKNIVVEFVLLLAGRIQTFTSG